MKTLSKFFAFVALFSVISLGGCQRVDLHHGLQEIETEELLVLLHQNGIDAKKEKEVNGQDVSWKISIKEIDEARARQILMANNLPHHRELGLSGVYKDKGLIPTPDEQKARFLLALKGEIINSLHKIPGIVDVDVVLNIPEGSEFADMDPVKKRPTASVVVKTRNDATVALIVTESKVQKFVANTVPNLDPNDVAVIVSRMDTGSAATPISPSPVSNPSPSANNGESPDSPFVAQANMVDVAGIHVDEESAGRFKLYIAGLLTLLMGVSGFLIYNIFQFNRLRLKVQKGARMEKSSSLSGAQTSGFLGEGAPSQGVEGTFDVGASQKQIH